ncbi:MFS transporter [Paraburkholderia sp. BL25I1N1]|uniref:MFS transporter n=1 Tax=Paraburkholderia sp. BL25I1N1 TaxID=1938804 RepID=UPI000D049DC5|nr:MFS transporter [Paraburkholderia sp. BL25I1N1]PRX92098.1 AAHS family 4-hydroxybenzoate transporter-like MFS transporter [Paraburkholderia sp. BL25I1N1]
MAQLEVLKIRDVVDSRPLGIMQWVTMALCFSVAVLDGTDTLMMGFVAPPMSASLHIPMKEFGPVFSAALVGLLLGALICGPLADKIGRRWLLIGCTTFFGLLTVITPSAQTFDQLLVIRFLTGLGLGGAMPSAVAIASEYSPSRMARTFVASVFCGMPTGGMIAGILSYMLIPHTGWQSVFYVGGILPLVIAVALIALVPESVCFLVGKGASAERIRKIVGRISPELGDTNRYRFISDEPVRSGVPVKYLFTEGRASQTILLWIPYAMNLLILYFVGSWMPALLHSAALPVSAGIVAVSLWNAAGVFSSPVQGVLMNRFSPGKVLFAEFFGYITLTLLLSTINLSFVSIMSTIFVMGICVQGAQAALNALAAEIYPTNIRSTGVGWALGVGRVGSIAGPLLGGAMVALNWDLSTIFVAAALPGGIAMVCVVANMLMRRGKLLHQRAHDTQTAPH